MIGNRFNPRTRVGCDKLAMLLSLLIKFQSTHPCGVRQLSPCLFASLCVSIHAPVWGATGSVAFRVWVWCFNPRTRVGCDYFVQQVSIDHQSFNPRTRVGCDHFNKIIWIIKTFQSTHPCGVRPKALYLGDTINNVSIHAPVWGATCRLPAVYRNGRFNPRTRVGCDLW